MDQITLEAIEWILEKYPDEARAVELLARIEEEKYLMSFATYGED